MNLPEKDMKKILQDTLTAHFSFTAFGKELLGATGATALLLAILLSGFLYPSRSLAQKDVPHEHASTDIPQQSTPLTGTLNLAATSDTLAVELAPSNVFTLTTTIVANRVPDGSRGVIRAGTVLSDVAASVAITDSVWQTVTVELAYGGVKYRLETSPEHFSQMVESSKTITKTSVALTSLSASEWVMATVTVNVRSGPGTDNVVVGSLAATAPAEPVLETRNGWVRLQDGEKGERWVSANYVKVIVPQEDSGTQENGTVVDALRIIVGEETGVAPRKIQFVYAPSSSVQVTDAINIYPVLAVDADRRVIAYFKVFSDHVIQIEFLRVSQELQLIDSNNNVAATEELPRQLTAIDRETLTVMGIPELPNASKFYRGPGDTYFGFDAQGELIGVKSTYVDTWTTGKTSAADVNVVSDGGKYIWNSEGVGRYNERLTIESYNALVEKYKVTAEQETEINRLISSEPTRMLLGIASLIVEEGDVVAAQRLATEFSNVSETVFVVGWKPDRSVPNPDYSFVGHVARTERAAFIYNNTLYILTGFYASEDSGADGSSVLQMVFQAIVEMMTGKNYFHDPAQILDAFQIRYFFNAEEHLIRDPIIK